MTKSLDLMKAMLEFGNKTEWKPAKRFNHPYDIVINQIYPEVYRVKKSENDSATIDVLELLQTETGNEVAKHSITRRWCDALYMIPPTLAKLFEITGYKSYPVTNDKFFQETYNLLYDKEENLFTRNMGYLINRKGEGKREAIGNFFGVTAMVGFSDGLARLLSELPKDLS